MTQILEERPISIRPSQDELLRRAPRTRIRLWSGSRLLAFLCLLVLGRLGDLSVNLPANTPSADAAAPPQPPFQLPFDVSAGPSTWMLGQLYGNTTSAYFLGDLWYAAGQGLHFGLDFTAPCGTKVVSIGDGIVVQPDFLSHGAGPHNLVVRYPVPGQPGREVIALYGHLLRRPELEVGQAVFRGQPVALTGDPDVTCSSRPHLHLEIRSPDYRSAFNPVVWIAADWNALMLLGPFSDVNYTRDLDDPVRWVQLDDQPDVRFGGPVLNDYRRAWPSQQGDVVCVVNGC